MDEEGWERCTKALRGLGADMSSLSFQEADRGVYVKLLPHTEGRNRYPAQLISEPSDLVCN